QYGCETCHGAQGHQPRGGRGYAPTDRRSAELSGRPAGRGSQVFGIGISSDFGFLVHADVPLRGRPIGSLWGGMMFLRSTKARKRVSATVTMIPAPKETTKARILIATRTARMAMVPNQDDLLPTSGRASSSESRADCGISSAMDSPL